MPSVKDPELRARIAEVRRKWLNRPSATPNLMNPAGEPAVDEALMNAQSEAFRMLGETGYDMMSPSGTRNAARAQLAGLLGTTSCP